MAGNAIIIFYTLIMAQRATKHTPADETKSVVSILAGVPVTGLARGYGVSGPTICRVLREKPEGARTGHPAVSFNVGWTRLGAFDAVTGRLGVESRVDALRRVCHAPASCLVSFPAPDPDPADGVRDASGQFAALRWNMNHRVTIRNSKVKRCRQLKLTRLRGQLSNNLPDHIDEVSTRVREMAEKRVSEIFRGFLVGMKGGDDGAH
jgi:hypothetical protein